MPGLYDVVETEKAPTLAELDTVLGAGEDESAADTMRATLAEFDETPAETKEPATEEPAPAENRDERGRFRAKTTEAEPTEATETVAEQPEPTTEGTDTDDVAEPPHEWTADEQDAFRQLPKALQDLTLRKVEAAQESAKSMEQFQALNNVLGPWRQIWQPQGLDDAKGVASVLNLWRWADQKPDEFANWFFKEKGLTIEGGGNEEGDGEPEYVDPDIQAIRQENAELRGQIQQINGTLQGQYVQAANQTKAQLQQEIQNFRDAKDEKGSPIHPYFDEVRADMSGLMRVNPNLTLDDAYTRAVRAHPETSRKIESAAKAEADRARRQEERAKAEAARRAGTSVSGDPSSTVAMPEPTGDARDDLRRGLADAGLY